MNGISGNNLLNSYINGTLTAGERRQVLLPEHAESCELLIACRPDDYSASAIAKAVEDCNARLLALTVTAMRDDDGRPVAMLTVDSRTPDGIVRSLARYGYNVIHSRGELSLEQRTEARERVNELLHILEL